MYQAAMLKQIDHARLGRFHLKLVLLSGFCWILAAYGVTIVGFLLPSLHEEWRVSSNALAWLASIGMLGMLAGSLLAGTLADRLGRRNTLALTLFCLGITFLLAGVSWNYGSLFAIRFFMGAGLGAIMPVSSTLIIEFAPARHRGTMSVLMNVFWGLGGSIAALSGYYLVLHAGWRPAMLVGSVALLVSPLIRWLLPESIRFLMDRGRMVEVQREFLSMNLDYEMPVPASTHEEPGVQEKSPEDKRGIWTRAYARLTFSLWFLWLALNFLYQGAFIWLPTLLSSTQASESRSFLLTLLISLGQIPGTLLVAFLVDRMSRTRLIVVSLVLLSAAAFVFGLVKHDLWIVVVGFLVMMFNGMAWAMGYPFSSEQYPTRMRGLAAGWASGIGRLGGMAAPLMVGWVVQAGGSLFHVFSLLASAPLLSALILSTFRINTTGRSLEDISGE